MLRDFAVGTPLPPATFTVDGPSMKVLSLLMRDPNPIHFDPAVVRSLGLGDRPINQGTINMAYPINVLLQIVDSPARLRRFRCRFQGTLTAGDKVVASGTVTAVDAETVSFDVWLDREGGERVLTGSAVIARP